MNLSTLYHHHLVSWRVVIVLIGAACGVIGMTSVAMAKSETQPAETGQRVVTIYDQGEKRVVLTRAKTVASTLKQANIGLATHDRVEPALESEYADAAQTYTVNIYRARPVVIVDGMKRDRVLTPYGSAKDIAQHAGIVVQDEDLLQLERSTDLLADGVGSKLTIERATSLTLVLYGEATTVYTQQATVGELLKEKNITIEQDDTLSVERSHAITEGMKIEVWRNGVQTVTEEQDVDFAVEQIQDADREVGYKDIKTLGVKGKKTVTYEVVMKNGEEVERKEIQSVVTKQPESQVEVVGAKPSFDGDFAAALTKLRACEAGGDYANKRNPLYRGAYQFGYGTWGNYGGYHDPADAPPGVQDQAARELYERRGWQPWPSCGASLPDVYR